MAKRSGMGQILCIGGYDLSGDVGVIKNAASPRGVQENTGLNVSSVGRCLLRGDGILEHNVWFNDAASQSFPVLKALPTADTQVLWGMSSTLGDPAAGLVAKQVNFDWAKRPDGGVEGAVQCIAQGTPLEWCRMLTGGVDTHTGATDEASVDDGVAGTTAYGIIGYVQVLAFNGTNITLTIQESSDNGSTDAWASKLAFTQITAARKFERKTATGNVERYLRVVSSGTFTTAEVLVVYRRGTVQDDEAL
jgi:hypothetical protein